MDFLLRPAQISDLEQILAIYNAEILDGTANWNNTTKSSADFQTWFSSLMAQQFPLFVAEHRASKKIAGYADYSAFRQIHGFKQTVEHSVFIHPDFSRQGLGKALMLKLIDHAQQHNRVIWQSHRRSLQKITKKPATRQSDRQMQLLRQRG